MKAFLTAGHLWRHRSGQTRWRLLWLTLLIAMGVWVFLRYFPSKTEPPIGWRRLPNLPVGVMAAAVSQVDNLVVISGGITQLGLTTNLIQVYDLHAGSWREPPQLLNTARAMHAQVTLADGRILIVGGERHAVPRRDSRMAEAELFDPQTGKSVLLPSRLQPAGRPTAHSLPNGQVIVVGGSVATLFDPVELKWSGSIQLRRPRSGHSSLMIETDKVLVGGGQHQRSFELINVRKMHSRLLSAKLPHPTDDLELLRLNDHRVWVIGGQNTRTGDTTDQTWILDLGHAKEATITNGSRLGIESGVADHCLVVFRDEALILGGESQRDGHDTALAEVRRLNLRTLEVSGLPPMQQAHDDAVAVGVGHGVIVFGGTYDDESLFGRRLPIASRRVEQFVRLSLP